MLDPAIQEFGVSAAAYLAGIDEMLSATDKLAESIDAAVASAKAMADSLSASADVADEGVEAATASVQRFAEAEEAAEAQAAALADSLDEITGAADTVVEAAGRAAETLAGQADAEKAAAEAAVDVVTSLDESAAALDRAAGAASVYVDAQGRLRLANGQFASSADAAALSADELAAAYERAGVSAKAAGGSVAVEGDESEAAAGKMDVAAGSAAGMGTAMKTALLGVAIALGYGIDKASGFQSSMEQLHTQAGVAQSKIAGLSQGVLQLSSQVGEGPDSLAESLYHVASNMASTGASSAQMLSAVKVAAEGAQVGNADLVDVTNALGAAIASGIPGVQNYTQAMGYMNATVGAGDMNMQNLADAFGTGVLANIKMYGVTLQDVSAALATFGDNNIRGAKAGTDLRMSVQAMVAPVATAGPALAQLGLTSTSLADAMKNGGLNSALQLFISHLKTAGVSSKDYGEIITDIFGKKAGSGIGVLVGEFDRFEGKYKQVKKGADDFASDWSSRTKTMSQQWDDLKSGAQGLAISFGTVLLPAATKVVGWLAKFLGFLEKHPALAAFAGAILAVAVAFKVVAAAEALFSAVTDANPVMLVLIAVIALAAGLYELYKHSKLVRDIVADVGHALERAFKWLVGAFDDVAREAKKLPGQIAHVWDDITSGAKRAGHAVAHAFSSGWDDVYRDTVGEVVRAFEDVKSVITGGFDGWWKSHGKAIEEVWHDVWATLARIFTAEWDAFMAVAKPAFGLVVAILALAWDDVSTAAKIAWDLVAAYVKTAWDLIAAIVKIGVDLVVAIAKTAWDVLMAVVKVVWAAITMVIKIAWDVIVGIFNVTLDLITGHWSQAWKDIQAVGVQVWNAIKGFLGTTLDAIWGLIRQVWNNVKGFLEQTFNAIKDLFTQAFDHVKDFLGQTWNAIWNGIVSVWGAVISFFRGVPGKILSALGDVGHLLWQAGVNIVDGLIGGIKSVAGKVTGIIGDLAHGNVIGAFSSAIGAMSPSKVFYKLGTWITQGLANGIVETTAAAAAKARSLAAAVKQAYADGQITQDEEESYLGQISDAIAERKDKLVSAMKKLGLEMGAGMLSSLENATSASTAKTAVDKLISYVQQAWSAGDISTSKASSMTAWLEADNSKLQSLAAQRQTLAATIKTAVAFANTTTSNTESWAGLSNVTSSMTSGGMVYSGNILSGMQADLSSINQFTAAIRKLGKMGLRKDLINQIIQMGPGQGLQVADALLNGPAKVIGEMNSTQAAIASGSSALGQAAANAMYDTGAAAGKGFLSGLQAQESQVTAMMNRVAKSMAATLKRELGEAGGGGSAAGMQVHVTVNGFVGSNAELTEQIRKELQQAVLQYNRRNGKNGLSLTF